MRNGNYLLSTNRFLSSIVLPSFLTTLLHSIYILFLSQPHTSNDHQQHWSRRNPSTAYLFGASGLCDFDGASALSWVKVTA